VLETIMVRKGSCFFFQCTIINCGGTQLNMFAFLRTFTIKVLNGMRAI